MALKRKIKTLIVDDSALVRKILKDLLSSDPNIEVIGCAGNPYLAANIIKTEVPDVITLDVEMPKMDGITFLKVLMSQRPVPVIVISSLTERNSLTALKALETGAFEVIEKPAIKAIKDPNSPERIKLLNLVKAAASAKINLVKKNTQPTEKKLATETQVRSSMVKTTEKITVMGSSTGGTEALKDILLSLPYDCPAIAIVQHMPELFTKSFAKRLDEICEIRVKEAEHGDTLLRGQALIAPGNKHMCVKRSGAKYIVEILEGPLVSRHRPSVDVLFNSAAKYVGRNCRGIILTGMGKDGAKGMLALKNAGADTIAQNEETCVVFGMPREAIKLNAAHKVLPLNEIPDYIC